MALKGTQKPQEGLSEENGGDGVEFHARLQKAGTKG